MIRNVLILGVSLTASAFVAGQQCGGLPIFNDRFDGLDARPSGVGASPTPYSHVMPSDVGVTIGVGAIGPTPTMQYMGPTTINEPTTIENVVVDGCLRIASDDVVIRNAVIECGGLYPVKIEGGSSGFRIEYSRVACESSSKVFYFESGAPGAVVENNEISGCQDFFYIQGDLDGVVIRNNYMHTLIGSSQAHADGFQIGEASTTTGAIHIQGNYIDPDNESIGKTDIVFGTNGSEAWVVIEDNFFEPWGNYTLRCGGAGTRCTVRNNVFSAGFQGVEQHLLLANATAPAEPAAFCCNRYADGSLVEEFFGSTDLVLGAEHIISGCPTLSGRSSL